jgi:hypothetical protein
MKTARDLLAELDAQEADKKAVTSMSAREMLNQLDAVEAAPKAGLADRFRRYAGIAADVASDVASQLPRAAGLTARHVIEGAANTASIIGEHVGQHGPECSRIGCATCARFVLWACCCRCFGFARAGNRA